MNFKNWLLLTEEETKNIVQGPILLYHATSTGEDNKTLNSFKNDGAKPMMGGGYGQGRGLYMMSLKGGPYSHAKKLAADKVMANVKHAGLPMVVSIEFPFIDTKEWDLDQEIHGGEIIEFIRKIIMYQGSKGLAPKNTIKVNTSLANAPKDQSMLAKDTPDTDSRYYPTAIGTRNKDVNIKWNPGVKSMQFLDKDSRTIDGIGSQYDDKKGYEGEDGHNAGSGGILSPLYLKYQMENPEFHHAQEAKFIRNRLKSNKKELAIKYVGDQTFPVKSIEVFKDGQWVTV